ncbi:MAG: hypothetical protein ABW321_12805 [Polyangiales bacterium]
MAALGCSADGPGNRPGGTGPSAGAGGLAVNPATPIVPTAGGSGKIAITTQAGAGGSRPAAPSDDVDACVQTAQEAQQVPVDMYIMLDRSDSMNEATGAGPSKWDAIRQALAMFLRDPRSEGLGVGLQFFPLLQEGVPAECSSTAECGPGGPCLNGVCLPSASNPSAVILCSQSSECPVDSDGCTMQVGQCSGDPRLICFDFNLLGCGLQGSCQQVNLLGVCGGADSCDADEYAQPAVPIAGLPGNAEALVELLDAEMTVGRTPTAAALSGALQHAREYATTQPTHRVIAVLATDGLPTECDPVEAEGIADLASAGLNTRPSVPTYVVGVFGADVIEARDNLDTWAAAGGTDSAFIVDATQDVAEQFLDALDTIRSGSIACEYQLPPSPQGSSLDFDRVNVALVQSSGATDFLYVGDASRCGLAPYGWHYDVDPASGGTPTKIVACARACEELKTTDNGRVEVRLGCLTMGPD